MPDNSKKISAHQALLAQGLTGASEAIEPDIQGYEIQRRLGQGGMSTVYLARESALDRIVALKIFNIEGIDEVNLARFRQEALMMASIQHPNVVSIYAFLSDDDEAPCLALEYVAGGDLRSRLRAEKRFSLLATLQIAIDVCSGLAELHRRSIVHRDIKPENILLTEEDVAKVADLGIALSKKTDGSAPSFTMTGTFVGTFAYLAPEQTTQSRERIDARVDVWAVGVLIYEMLVGSTPQAMLVSDLLQDIPPAIKPILKKCLRRDPEDRYSTIEKLQAALTQLQNPNKKPLILASTLGLLVLGVLLGVIFRQSDPAPSNQPPSTEAPTAATPTESVSKPPPRPVKHPTEKGWKNLLTALPRPLRALRGRWTLSANTLTCQTTPQGACMVVSTNSPGDNYDLSLSFTRIIGQDSMTVYLPTSIGMLNFDIDGWRQHFAGIQDLDGQDMRVHGETFPFTLVNGQRYQLLLKVRSHSIETLIDGKSYYTWNLRGKSASITPILQAPVQNKLALGAWNSTMQFRDVQVRTRSTQD